MRSIRRLGIVLIATTFFMPLFAGCENATQPEDENPPEEEHNPKGPIVGHYDLETIDGDSLPLRFRPIAGENMEIREGQFEFSDTTSFKWRLRTYHDPPASTSDEARFEVIRSGEWSILEADTVGAFDATIALFFNDTSVDTASFVVPSDPTDRRGVLTIHSLEVPWVYRKHIPRDRW